MPNEKVLDIRELTMSSPYEAALSVMQDQHFTPDFVTEYLRNQGKNPEETSRTANELSEFLASDLVRTQFSDYWPKETSGAWTGRTPEQALRETALHGFATIHALAEDFLYDGSYGEYFPGMDRTQVERVVTSSQLASTIFYASLAPNEHT